MAKPKRRDSHKTIDVVIDGKVQTLRVSRASQDAIDTAAELYADVLKRLADK